MHTHTLTQPSFMGPYVLLFLNLLCLRGCLVSYLCCSQSECVCVCVSNWMCLRSDVSRKVTLCKMCCKIQCDRGIICHHIMPPQCSVLHRLKCTVMHTDVGIGRVCEWERLGLKRFLTHIHAPVLCFTWVTGWRRRKWGRWGGTFGLVLCFPEDQYSSATELAWLISSTSVHSHGLNRIQRALAISLRGLRAVAL